MSVHYKRDVKKTNQPATDEWRELDRLIARDGIYEEDYDFLAAFRRQEILRVFEYHVKHNSGYAAYCSRRGVSPERLARKWEPEAIPLLPSSVFKEEGLLCPTTTGGDAEALLMTTSSGTKGTLSLVPRDDDTLMRFFATVASGVREVLEIRNYSMPVFNLGPPPEEAESLWISYVMAGAAVIFHSRNYVFENELLLDSLMEDLERETQPAVLIGPPALVLAVAEAAGKQLPPASIILTIGGWKKAASQSIAPEDFRALCSERLGVTPQHVHDVFNMVELNTAIFSCQHHVKHVPPWLEVLALDPRTLQQTPEGEMGILAYLDPTSRSFPCFILSDDFGCVSRRIRCACGRAGDTIEIRRRINSIEMRGCATKMDYRASGKIGGR